MQDGAWQIYKRSEQDLYKLKVETEFELEGDKMETEVSNSLNGILQTLEGQMGFASVTDWQNGLAYDDITYRYYYQNGGHRSRRHALRVPAVRQSYGRAVGRGVRTVRLYLVRGGTQTVFPAVDVVLHYRRLHSSEYQRMAAPLLLPLRPCLCIVE